MVELANTSAQKYLDLAQKSFGRAAASDARADLVRKLSENFTTFAQEYSESLMGIAADAQSVVKQQVQDASGRLAKTRHAAIAVVANASNRIEAASGQVVAGS